MEKIRAATTLVCGNLTESEKLELIKLLTKLNEFHVPIYKNNTDVEKLLEEADQISAAAYCSKEGNEVHVFEKHDLAWRIEQDNLQPKTVMFSIWDQVGIWMPDIH
ncbi:hypothetical protein FQR65_LT20938 [Abscondita terminalis]|nr:hypothetical protein FQR65_LT20938 [Abscondita terminalis]